MSITIYGYSDDLIEVEGDIREEFPYPDQPCYIGCSDGTVVRIEYGGTGQWRITPASGVVTIEQCPEDDDDNYSDRATIGQTGVPITWVVVGTDWAKP